MTYAGTCMTSILSITAANQTQYQEQHWRDFFTRLLGNDGKQMGGTLGKYNRAPVFMKHAFSPYADAMFHAVSPLEWVYTDEGGDDEYQRFDGLYSMIDEFPAAYTFHPNPQIGTGKVAVAHWEDDEMLDPEGWELSVNYYAELGMGPIFDYYDQLLKYHDIFGAIAYVPYCSLNTMRTSGAEYTSLSDPAMLPEHFKADLRHEHNWSKRRPADWGMVLRHRIAERFIGPSSDKFCAHVSLTGNRSTCGCLIANKYKSDSSVQQQALKEVQDTFNTHYRPMLEAQITAATAAAGSLAHIRSPDSSSYSGTPPATSLWIASRDSHFTDMYFFAPGVQSQIGLFGDHRAQNHERDDSNWFVDLIFSVGGYVAPTIAGVFAWIAAVLAKIALMIYPHMLGLMTFFLIILSVPYLVRGLLPGQYFVPLEWMKAVAVVCLIPFFGQFGLALIEQGNSMAVMSLFIRTTAGGDVGEAICNLFGAGIIMSSFSLAAACVALGFGTLAGLLGTINANAFKLTGPAPPA